MYTILIVDDELSIREGIGNYFPWNQLGFEVVGQFENGRRALEYCHKHSIDVIISDIKMPIMDGLELFRELYREKYPAKLVLLSGYREFEFAREALKYEVKHYLVKPTKYEELYEVFSRIKEDLDRERQSAPESETSEAKSINDGGYYQKIVSKVKFYISNNYRTATLEDASRVVHINPNYLSKLFKSMTGENFSDFLLGVRMQKAASLLNDITYKTYQISELVGYSNPKNFTRTFKKFYGVTPKEFRNSPQPNLTGHH